MKEYKENHHSLLYKSNSDLALYSAGYEECRPGQNYGPRVRPYQLIHFGLSGSGRLHMNEHIFDISAGDAFLIPAGSVSYYEASQDDPWVYAWINFLGIQSQTYMLRIMTAAEGYVIHGLPVEKYQAAIFKILNLQGDNTSSFLAANSILLQILSFLFGDIDFREQDWGQRYAADEIRFYLDMNYPKKLKLKDVAAHLGYHPHYMTRIFRERFGVAPKQYLTDLKMKKASVLLRSTRLPVGVVAESLGFEDALAFSRLFKQEFGQSPGNYRRHAESPSSETTAGL